MNVIMLSGNSLRNRDWILDMQTTFTDNFEKTYVQMYEHWLTGESDINLDHEQAVLESAASGLEPYGVFAKSMGTVLTVKALQAGFLKPHFLLVLGIPVSHIKKTYDSFFDVLVKYNIPVIIIQNGEDPVGKGSELLAQFKSEIPEHITINVVPGDTHDYIDKGLMQTKLKLLLDSPEQI